MTNIVFVRIVATAVVIVFAVGIWATGGDLDVGWLRFFSVSVLVGTVLLWIWETVLWKTRVAQRLRSVPRDVSGTWKGTLYSLWRDPEIDSTREPKSVYLVVRQTASSVSVMLLTDESRSVSSHGVVSDHGGVASLNYMYLNRPDMRVEHRSRVHHGSTSLDITGLPATRLMGRYWTDRDTKGELDLVERRRKTAEDFEQARALFQE